MKRITMFLGIATIAVAAACSGDGNLISPKNTASNVPSVSKSVVRGSCTVPIGGVLTTVPVGYDQNGYNRCAHIFNGTYAGYCADRNLPPDCGGVDGSTSLIMKWNAEWDRGNVEGWTNPPYAANLDNEIKGSYPDGTPFSEHFKATWDAGCAASTNPVDPNTGESVGPNGSTCIWRDFLVLMDQGTENGAKVWWTKWSPAGYGN